MHLLLIKTARGISEFIINSKYYLGFLLVSCPSRMKRILNTYGILLLSKVVLLYSRLVIARGECFETPRTYFVAGVSVEEPEASIRLHG